MTWRQHRRQFQDGQTNKIFLYKNKYCEVSMLYTSHTLGTWSHLKADWIWLHWIHCVHLLSNHISTNFRGYRVMIQGKETIDKNSKSNQRCWKQPSSVKSKPCKIDSNFFSKVISDVIQWLIFVPPLPSCPVFIKNLSCVQLSMFNFISRPLKITLKESSVNRC